MSYSLAGVAVMASGLPVPRIAVLRWSTLDRVASVVPDSDGAWSAAVEDAGPFAVVATGTYGYQPVIDGPIPAVED